MTSIPDDGHDPRDRGRHHFVMPQCGRGYAAVVLNGLRLEGKL